jgi:hypothetical protein
LLTATALLAALLPTLSGLLLLLTWLLLAALLAAALLLLPALLHITHFVVRHGGLSFAEGIRGTTISLRRCWFPTQAVALTSNAGTHRNKGSEPVVSSNYRHAGRFHAFSARKMSYKMSYRQWPNGIPILEQLRCNPAPIADRY